ncbi:TerB family tellurite resistance protein [Pseudoalteromonas sp. SSDWG2]|uniref:TerB family tellurite resistance protein n=1 Tax=Pseudoalteromonas sp. SSDWG2 TaxID=3139391 RepID=UPI003BAC0C58
MHIILGVLGTVVTILVLINRLSDAGLDIGWLNPFSWHRRRKFRKKYELAAAYSLESPMDVAALFLVAVAKVDGDMSAQQKQAILNIFTNEFNLSEQEAKSLLGASVHIYGRSDEVIDNPKAVLARSKEKFTQSQISSLIELLEKLALIDGVCSQQQTRLINSIKAQFI